MANRDEAQGEQATKAMRWDDEAAQAYQDMKGISREMEQIGQEMEQIDQEMERIDQERKKRRFAFLPTPQTTWRYGKAKRRFERLKERYQRAKERYEAAKERYEAAERRLHEARKEQPGVEEGAMGFGFGFAISLRLARSLAYVVLALVARSASSGQETLSARCRLFVGDGKGAAPCRRPCDSLAWRGSALLRE